MNKPLLYLIKLSLIFLPLWAAAKTAAKAAPISLGGVAGNLLEPVGLMSDFVQTGCFILGSAFLFATIIKYVEHKRSPLMVPISVVVFLFVAGIVLIALPFLYLLTENGLPYSFLSKFTFK